MRDATSDVAGISGAVHLCIDMQNIFAPGGLWATPWMERVLPTIVSAVSRYPERTIFTRFITPQDPEDRPGQWQGYFAAGTRPPAGICRHPRSNSCRP